MSCQKDNKRTISCSLDDFDFNKSGVNMSCSQVLKVCQMAATRWQCLIKFNQKSSLLFNKPLETSRKLCLAYIILNIATINCVFKVYAMGALN